MRLLHSAVQRFQGHSGRRRRVGMGPRQAGQAVGNHRAALHGQQAAAGQRQPCHQHLDNKSRDQVHFVTETNRLEPVVPAWDYPCWVHFTEVWVQCSIFPAWFIFKRGSSMGLFLLGLFYIGASVGLSPLGSMFLRKFKRGIVPYWAHLTGVPAWDCPH